MKQWEVVTDEWVLTCNGENWVRFIVQCAVISIFALIGWDVVSAMSTVLLQVGDASQKELVMGLMKFIPFLGIVVAPVLIYSTYMSAKGEVVLEKVK